MHFPIPFFCADTATHRVSRALRRGSATLFLLLSAGLLHAESAPVIGGYTRAAARAPGGSVTIQVTASGDPAPTFQWSHNGRALAGATSGSLTLSGLQPEDTGIYSARVANTAGAQTVATIVGLNASTKVVGAGRELDPKNIVHPNGNIFDQVLLTGAAESITADAGQITRTSYVDVDGDIVQVEFSGAGTLSLVLDAASGPATPEKYTQPDVSYMKGHVGIVIAGADENTHVSVFTVGRATAYDPTGGYDITKSISANNDPANNGSPLFAGRPSSDYDGVADIAFIAIMSSNTRFGSVRAANAHFFAPRGYTGVYAPNVQFSGPVLVGDVSAFDAAMPVLMLGSADDVRITGGDLLQDNGAAVQVSGIEQLKFVAGTDSHGRALPAQQNRAVLMQAGQDVTSKIVVNP